MRELNELIEGYKKVTSLNEDIFICDIISHEYINRTGGPLHEKMVPVEEKYINHLKEEISKNYKISKQEINQLIIGINEKIEQLEITKKEKVEKNKTYKKILPMSQVSRDNPFSSHNYQLIELLESIHNRVLEG